MNVLTKKINFILFFLLTIILVYACGNKGAKEAQKTKTETKTKPDDNQNIKLNEDAMIGSEAGLYGPDSLETVKQISLYREFYKQKLYDDALPYWRYVYKNAPKLRKYTYLNGTKMYEDKAKEAKKAGKEKAFQAYLDTMFAIYDKRVEHFGEEGTVLAYKAYKLKKYRPEQEDLYDQWVKKSVDIQQDESEYFVIYPYFQQIIRAYNAKSMTAEDVYEQHTRLSDYIDYNVEQENDVEKYENQRNKIDELVERVREANKPKEIVTKTITCADIKNNEGNTFRSNPNDLAMVKKLYAKLSRYNCKNDPLFAEVYNKLYELQPTASRAKRAAQIAINNKNYAEAETHLLKALELETDNTKKAKIYMYLAGVERRKVGDLTTSVATQARKYAKQAAELQPGWGKPYMFIGDLYASSGPLCGSGRGWNSQVVAWAACDMWAKAKEIDPEVAKEAQQSINNYSRYFPLKSEGFMKSVTEGQQYRIGCWIGTSARARFREG